MGDDGPVPDDSRAGKAGPDPTLRRLLRKPEIAAFLTTECARLGPGHGLADAEGRLLIGDDTLSTAEAADIVVADRSIGRAHGPSAAELARLLEVLAAQDAEIRALAREALDRYKEVTMLNSVSEKIIGASDAAAALICEEAERFLRCDTTAVLLLNSETNRLELAAFRGSPFLDRSTREIGDDIVASVFRSGIGEIVNDVDADPRSILTAHPLRSLIGSPLKSGGRIFGVLVCATREPRHLNAGDLQILNSLAGQGAAAIEVARLDLDLRTGSPKPIDLIYGVDERPPMLTSLLLGIQHVLIAVMSLAYPVLVTLEAGGSRLTAASVVSMSLVAMAIATLLQTVRRGPLGSGYFVTYITAAIYLGPSLLAARMGGLPLVFGMTILAGAVSLAMSQLLRRFRKLFPPEISGVVVLMVGLSIVPVALPRFMGIDGIDLASEPGEWLVGGLTLGMIIALTVLPLGRVRLYATAAGLATGFIAAGALGLFDTASLEPVRDLPIIGVHAKPFVGLSFAPLLIVPFAAAAIAASVMEAGLVISCQKTNDADWKRPGMRSVSGGVAAGGLGNIAAGALGGVGITISPGNIGLAAATGATSRAIGVTTAGLFLLLAFMPQATGMLALIPSPVMGAGLLYVACHLVSSGAQLITSRMLDARRNYVIGLPLLAGVGLMAAPELAADLPEWARTAIGSPLALATIIALGLNLMLNAGVSNRARAQVSLERSFSERISRFFERQGASWGARSDVVRRAAPAVTEWCEELREHIGATGAEVELEFDEFRMVATIRASGSPTDDAGADEPGASELDPSLARAVATIARRYDCVARPIGRHGVSLAFEH